MLGRRLFCRTWLSFVAASKVQLRGKQVRLCSSMRLETSLRQRGCLQVNSNWSTPYFCSLWHLSAQLFHSSPASRGLEEFFPKTDDIIEEGEHTGNRWEARVLRQKSNEDLHKLWYVLLKERNMLLTLKHEANRAGFIMPSPERMWKVRKSMAKIKLVIGERERAIKEAKRILEGKPPIIPENPMKKKKKKKKFVRQRQRSISFGQEMTQTGNNDRTLDTHQENKTESIAV